MEQLKATLTLQKDAAAHPPTAQTSPHSRPLSSTHIRELAVHNAITSFQLLTTNASTPAASSWMDVDGGEDDGEVDEEAVGEDVFNDDDMDDSDAGLSRSHTHSPLH